MPRHVADVLEQVRRERQRALLYSHARRQLVSRYLAVSRDGDAVDSDVLASVLEHLLIEADAASQRAQRLLRQRVAATTDGTGLPISRRRGR